MDVKLGDILSGRTRGRRKPKHHRIVDRLVIGVAQQHPRRHARQWNLAGQRGQRHPGQRSGYPHDRNRARRPAR
jgi:hypothetical protein